ENPEEEQGFCFSFAPFVPFCSKFFCPNILLPQFRSPFFCQHIFPSPFPPSLRALCALLWQFRFSYLPSPTRICFVFRYLDFAFQWKEEALAKRRKGDPRVSSRIPRPFD